MEYKLYVGNLSYSTSETDLQTLFAEAGAVKSVALIKDRDSGRSKGFAFIEMENQKDMQNAITMFNGKEFQGQCSLKWMKLQKRTCGSYFRGQCAREI